MVRNHTSARAGTSSRVIDELDASDSSEVPDISTRSTRRNTQQQTAQKKQTAQKPKSRKQNNPQSRQQIQNKNQQEMTPCLQDIARFQLSTRNLICRAPFGRLLREILQIHGDFRMTKDAFDTFQEATEIYLVQLFEDAYRATLHRKRVTLLPSDIALVFYIRGINDPGCRA